MIAFAEALAHVLAAAAPLAEVGTPLAEAVGLAAARDVRSPMASPPFANSAMDGYALRAADLAAGRRAFAVVGQVPAGSTFAGPIGPGEAVRILTGAAVPGDVDTVVPQEDVRVLDGGRIEVLDPPKPGAHVRPAGEDFPAGELLLRAGQALDPAAVGLLAATGHPLAPTRRRPRVAVLSTGDELLDAGEPLAPGKIRDSNGYALAAAAAAAGALPYLAGRVPDRLDDLVAALAALPADADVIVTSGGVSVGDYDLVAPGLERLGFRPIFHKVNIKPGKPLLFGLLGHKLVFGLSGNPTAALVLFEMLVRPALRQMMGHAALFRPRVRAALARELRKRDGRMHFLRAVAEPVRIFAEGEPVGIFAEGEPAAGGWRVAPLQGQSSANLLALTRANALAVHPAERPVLAAGEEIEVHLIHQAEGQPPA